MQLLSPAGSSSAPPAQRAAALPRPPPARHRTRCARCARRAPPRRRRRAPAGAGRAATRPGSARWSPPPSPPSPAGGCLGVRASMACMCRLLHLPCCARSRPALTITKSSARACKPRTFTRVVVSRRCVNVTTVAGARLPAQTALQRIHVVRGNSHLKVVPGLTGHAMSGPEPCACDRVNVPTILPAQLSSGTVHSPSSFCLTLAGAQPRLPLCAHIWTAQHTLQRVHLCAASAQPYPHQVRYKVFSSWRYSTTGQQTMLACI